MRAEISRYKLGEETEAGREWWRGVGKRGVGMGGRRISYDHAVTWACGSQSDWEQFPKMRSVEHGNL